MWAYFSAFQAVLDLWRKCPVCGKVQKVSLSNKGKTITCSNCDAPIPPVKNKL